jgi:hypothetical protein
MKGTTSRRSGESEPKGHARGTATKGHARGTATKVVLFMLTRENEAQCR